MQLQEIIDNLSQKYRDAELLLQNKRYSNAIYLCGYCIELALKHTIAIQLNWTGFDPPASLKCMKVHDFGVLIRLTGREVTIKRLPAWSTAIKWTPDMRYEDPTKARHEDACEMIDATRSMVEELCKIYL